MTDSLTRSFLLLASIGLLNSCATSTISVEPSTSLGRQDLVSGRPHASMLFYQNAFGWSASRKGSNGYWELQSENGQAVGGVISLPKAGDKATWLTTVDVENLEETLAKVTEKGGVIVHGPVTVYGHVQTAVVTDPEGARFQLRQSQAQGRSALWVWHELVTENVADSAAWYAEVLGLIPQAVEGTERVMLLLEDTPVAAVSPNPFIGEPNQWIPVLGVDDIKTQLQAVLKHGGTVVTMSDADDRKIALVADPQGAPFLLQQTGETQP